MESWKAGDTVRITSGTFEGMEGTFVSVDIKRQEVKAKIRLFERETEVVLGVGEVVVVGGGSRELWEKIGVRDPTKRK